MLFELVCGTRRETLTFLYARHKVDHFKVSVLTMIAFLLSRDVSVKKYGCEMPFDLSKKLILILFNIFLRPESEVTSTVTIQTPEQNAATESNPVVWKGEINMPDVAKFSVLATQVMIR